MATREKFDNLDLELMAQFDGELAGDVGVGDLDATDASLKLEALEALSDAVRDSHESALESALESAGGGDPFASMWSAIERRVTTNGATSEAAQGEASEAKARPRAAEPTPSLWGAFTDWLDRYRSQMATGALCAVAAAALVWFVRPPDKSVEYVEVRANAPTTAATTILTSSPAEVESLEVYDGSGVVLTIPSETGDGAATTVIWLSPPDDEESVEGPI